MSEILAVNELEDCDNALGIADMRIYYKLNNN